MGLNEQQQEAIEKGCYLYKQGERKYSILGAGGTGKTYTANEFIKELKETMKEKNDEPIPVLVLAPTNKALKVISQTTQANDFRTIHSALGLQGDYDSQGKLNFNKPGGSNKIEEYRIIVIDEISMVPENIKKMLISRCENNNIFVIGLGDQYQHFPVNEKTCSLINYFGDNSYTLSKIMRQGGNNPITNLIADSREAVISRKKNYDPRENYGDTTTIKDEDGVPIGYYCYYDQEPAIKQMRNAYNKALRTQNYDLVKTICWRNNTVRSLNFYIRQMLFGKDADIDYIPGDLIICRSPLTKKVWSERLQKYMEMTIIHTSTEGIVQDATPISIEYKHEPFEKVYQGWEVNFRPINSEFDHKITLIHSSYIRDYEVDNENIRNYCRESAKSGEKRNIWYKYYDHIKLFNNFQHSYAITSHLSQGSTYENVFVNADDIARNTFDIDGRNRTFYVALSRASKRVIMF